MDQIGRRLVRQPLGGDGRIDVRLIDIAALVQLRRDGGRFLVVGLLDGLNQDVVRIPVGGVLGVHALLLRLEGGEHIGAVVQDVLVAGGHAEVRALLREEIRVHRHEAHIGHHGQEVGNRLDQRVLQGVVIQRLHADGVPVHHRIRLLALLRGAGAQVVRLGAGDDGVEDVGGRGGVVRIQDVLRGGDEVVGRHLGILGAVGLHPGRILTELEGVGQVRLVIFPAFRQGRLHLAVLVVLHQGVDDIGGHRELVGRRGDQIVERSEFTRIQRAVSGAFRSGRHHGHAQGNGQAQRKRHQFLHVSSPFSRFFQHIGQYCATLSHFGQNCNLCRTRISFFPTHSGMLALIPSIL